MAVSQFMTGIGIGKIEVQVLNGYIRVRIWFSDALHVPDLGDANLFSMSHVCDKGL